LHQLKRELGEKALEGLDLEGDWDEEAHDREMKRLYDAEEEDVSGGLSRDVAMDGQIDESDGAPRRTRRNQRGVTRRCPMLSSTPKTMGLTLNRKVARLRKTSRLTRWTPTKMVLSIW
jgi:hypothetical protein